MSKTHYNVNVNVNITLLSIERTGRKPCSIREKVIGIVMVSERKFDNLTTYGVVICLHCKGFIET